MSSIANGSAPMKRSRKASNAPSTASAQPSRLASPQPTAPSSLSTRTNSQRGGTTKVSIRPILRSVTCFCLIRLGAAAAKLAPGCIRLLHLADLLDRDHQANALRGKHVAPVGDEPFVGLADIADLAVEVEQPEWVHIAILLAQRRVPVDLVGQAVPS